MMTKLILIILCVLSLEGCAITANQKTELLFAQNTFLRTVNTLTLLKEAGKFNDDQVVEIRSLIISGDHLLDTWTEGVLSGEPLPNISTAFELVLIELIEYRVKGENHE